MALHEKEDGSIKFLTKGDNNAWNDWEMSIYPAGQLWLDRTAVIGRVRGILPYLGLGVATLNDLSKEHLMLDIFIHYGLPAIVVYIVLFLEI